jgi:ATP-binding cassette subfamily B (MDR/TAP) protein 7
VDICNHSNETGTRTKLSRSDHFIGCYADNIKNNETELTFQIYTETAFKRNEQIFIKYGDFDNTRLLLEYGFFVVNNKHDALEFTLGDIRRFIEWQADLKYLEVPLEKYDYIRENGIDKKLSINLADGLSHNLQVVFMILILPSNSHHLPKIEYFKNYNFDGIQQFAGEFLEQKLAECRDLWNSLDLLEELSESGKMLAGYLVETSRFLEKVLERHYY